jgi:predicted GNAT family N-acyltransferase
MLIREIEDNDYYKGYLNVINVFTREPTDVDYESFKKQLNNCLQQNAIILVAENDDMIIGTLKILKEYKLHNNLSTMAHIEDVAVHPDYRRMKVGSQLITKALEYTKDCYKTVLSCKPELSSFYIKEGFSQAGIVCTLYNLTSASVMPSK